jgi:hypothetical protein
VEIVVPVATLPARRTYDVILDELLTEKTGLAEAVLAPASCIDGRGRAGGSVQA